VNSLWRIVCPCRTLPPSLSNAVHLVDPCSTLSSSLSIAVRTICLSLTPSLSLLTAACAVHPRRQVFLSPSITYSYASLFLSTNIPMLCSCRTVTPSLSTIVHVSTRIDYVLPSMAYRRNRRLGQLRTDGIIWLVRTREFLLFGWKDQKVGTFKDRWHYMARPRQEFLLFGFAMYCHLWHIEGTKGWDIYGEMAVYGSSVD
jgi:hypothetical protein